VYSSSRSVNTICRPSAYSINQFISLDNGINQESLYLPSRRQQLECANKCKKTPTLSKASQQYQQVLYGPRTDGGRNVRWPSRVLPRVSQFDYTPRFKISANRISVKPRAILGMTSCGVGHTDRQTDRRKDGHQTDALRLPLGAWPAQ